LDAGPLCLDLLKALQSVYSLTGKDENLQRARRVYDLIWDLNRGQVRDPSGLGPKTIAETRTGRSLADPMIYLNLTSVLRKADPQWAGKYDERAAQCVHDIFIKKRGACSLMP